MNLEDLNDNSPIFGLTQYVAQDLYREDEAQGTEIITGKFCFIFAL